MKTVAIELTEKELGLLMYVTEGYSAHAQLQAAAGKRDKKKTKDLTDRLCQMNLRLYEKLREIHKEDTDHV